MVQLYSVSLVLLLITFSLTPSYSRRRRRRRRCLPRHCRVGSWTSWSTCSLSCGGGVRSRTRTKTSIESCGGRCPYDLIQTQTCKSQCCPVNCIHTWSTWSSCSGCGNSTQTRKPIIKRPNSCNGRACPSTETQFCNSGM